MAALRDGFLSKLRFDHRIACQYIVILPTCDIGTPCQLDRRVDSLAENLIVLKLV